MKKTRIFGQFRARLRDWPWGRICAALGWAILGCGLIVRTVHYLGNRSLWVDEALLALNILERGLPGLLQPLESDQGAPVLFLWMVKAATMLFGSGELALRLVPFLASLIGLVLFYGIAAMFLGRCYPTVALFMYAFSFRLVYYSQEAKQYAVDVAVALALSFLFMRMLTRRGAPSSRATMGLLGLGGCIAVFLSHPSVFVLAGIGSTLIILKARKETALSYSNLAQLIVPWLIAFGMDYFFFLRGLASNETLLSYWAKAFFPVPTGLESAKQWFRAGDSFLEDMGYGRGWQVFVGALATVGVAVGARRGCLGSCSFLFAAFFTAMAAALEKYPFSERFILFLFPYLILLVVKALQMIGEGGNRAISVLLAAWLLVPSIFESFYLCSTPMVREETRPLLTYLQEHRLPGDQVYVFHGAVPAVRYYLRKGGVADRAFHFGESFRKDRPRLLRDMEAMSRWPRVWFLISHGPEKHKALLLSRVKGTLLEEHHNPGASLYLFGFGAHGSGLGREGANVHYSQSNSSLLPFMRSAYTLSKYSFCATVNCSFHEPIWPFLKKP